MIKDIKEKIYSTTGKKILSNFFSLSSIQMVSYILPLITIPYLVRTLGVEKFGIIAFAQVIIQYFVIFTDYGFGLSATKQISEHNGNQTRLNQIFSSVLFIKVAMLIISFILLSFLIFGFKDFEQEWQLYYLTFGVVLGQVLFPVWYFQGIEKMYITALVNIIPKIIFTISIFIFVNSPEDYMYVPLINSLGFIFGGLLSLWLATRSFNASFVMPSLSQLKYQLKEGWHIFLGSLGINFSILNIVFVLGVLTSPTIVGYYAAIEKIIRPISSLIRPVINAIFPHLAKTAKLDLMQSYNFSKKVSLIMASMMFMVGSILFVYSDSIIFFIFGQEFHNSSTVLKIMAFIPMIHSFLHIFLIPNMIIFNLKVIYSKIIFYGMIFSVFSSIILIKLFSVNGAALATLLTDIFISVSMYLYLVKHINLGEQKNVYS